MKLIEGKLMEREFGRQPMEIGLTGVISDSIDFMAMVSTLRNHSYIKENSKMDSRMVRVQSTFITKMLRIGSIQKEEEFLMQFNNLILLGLATGCHCNTNELIFQLKN